MWWRIASLKVFHGTDTAPELGQRSGYYPGTYAYSVFQEEALRRHGGNVYKTDIDPSELYHLQDTDHLKDLAEEAGFGRREGSGYLEVQYLLSQGYKGMARGNEIILFTPHTWTKVPNGTAS